MRLLPEGATLPGAFEEMSPEDRKSLPVDFLDSPEGKRWQGTRRSRTWCTSRVKAHGDPELARATAAAVCRVAGGRADRDRVEVLSFHTTACEETVRQRMPARLVAWADYTPAALADWASRAGVSGVCIEHFLLHPALVDRLRIGGLSVTTGTVNDATLSARAAALGVDAITTDRPAALGRELAAMLLAA